MIPDVSPVYTQDGFAITAAEPWFKVKVQLLQQYLQSSINLATDKSDEIIVVDLFAGNGLYSLGYQKELFPGTCLASLQTELPINKWIFCERDAESFKALKIRVNKYFKGRNVQIFDDSLDKLPEKMQYYVPVSKRGYRVHVVCFADPFSIDMPFSLIDRLCTMGFNFIIPFNISLNERHNYHFYLHQHQEKLKRFLGCMDLEKIKDVKSNAEFYKRMVKIFSNNMQISGLSGSLSAQRLESGLMELPMYYIGIYSKQFPARSIQRSAEESLYSQFTLFDTA